MLRMHVHVGVKDIEDSVRFYTTLFSAEPTVKKDDYAKWMLDNPRLNFAISARGATVGVEHLGIQVENDDELREIYSRLAKANSPVSKKARLSAATPKAKKAGLTIRKAFHGRRFSPLAKARSTVMNAPRPGVVCPLPSRRRQSPAARQPLKRAL